MGALLSAACSRKQKKRPAEPWHMVSAATNPCASHVFSQELSPCLLWFALLSKAYPSAASFQPPSHNQAPPVEKNLGAKSKRISKDAVVNAFTDLCKMLLAAGWPKLRNNQWTGPLQLEK